MVDSVAGQKLSVRETENMVKNHKEKTSSPVKKSAEPTLLEKYTESLNEVLPFRHKSKAKSLEIHFENEKEIEAFIALLKVEKIQKPETLLKRILK
jgi:ParB family chromosome partitioning protein